MSRASDLINQITHDYLTGLDGKTYAIGRGFGIATFLIGMPGPWIVGIYAACTMKTDLKDWGIFLGASAGYYLAFAGAVAAMIGATNFTEPQGKGVVMKTNN